MLPIAYLKRNETVLNSRFVINDFRLHLHYIRSHHSRKLLVNAGRPHHRVHSESDGNHSTLRTRLGVQNPIRVCRHLARWSTPRTISGPESNARASRSGSVPVEILRSCVQVIPSTTAFYLLFYSYDTHSTTLNHSLNICIREA